MTESKILNSLIGEKVSIKCFDRQESTFYGELLDLNELGSSIKHLDHGREFIEFIPMANINSISHKVFTK